MITSSTGYGKSCRCEMPTLSLPAVSLRLQLRLLALRILIIATNYLIYTVLSAIRRAISETDSNFLPALREADARATGSVDREMSCYQTFPGRLTRSPARPPPSEQGENSNRSRKSPFESPIIPYISNS